MKKTMLLALALGLVFAVLPAVAGDGHDHDEMAYSKKCTADAQSCLNWFAGKYENRGWAGVSLEQSEGGLVVKEVHPGTPAEKAGVMAGDMLLAINGLEYGNPDDKENMAGLEAQMVPGAAFTYTISRNGKTRDIGFALAPMPMETVAAMVGAHMLTDHASVEVASADD